MIAGTDFVGIATLITAIGASIASILAVFIGRGNAQKSDDIHAAVTTPPDTSTLGQTVADIKKIVNGKDDHAQATPAPAPNPDPKRPRSV